MRHGRITSLPERWSYFQAQSLRAVSGGRYLTLYGDGAALGAGIPETFVTVEYGPYLSIPRWQQRWRCDPRDQGQHEAYGPSMIDWYNPVEHRAERLVAYTGTILSDQTAHRQWVGLARGFGISHDPEPSLGIVQLSGGEQWTNTQRWIESLRGLGETRGGTWLAGLTIRTHPDVPGPIMLWTWDRSALTGQPALCEARGLRGNTGLIRYIVDDALVPTLAGSVTIDDPALVNWWWGDVAVGPDLRVYALAHSNIVGSVEVVELVSVARAIDWDGTPGDDLTFTRSGRVFRSQADGARPAAPRTCDGGYIRDENGGLLSPGGVLCVCGNDDYSTRGATWLEYWLDDGFAPPLSWGQPISDQPPSEEELRAYLWVLGDLVFKPRRGSELVVGEVLVRNLPHVGEGGFR